MSSTGRRKQTTKIKSEDNKREVDKRNTIRNLKNKVQQNAHAASNAALQNKNLIDK